MNKLPWKYAADFMAAGADKEKQKQALEGCPKIWQDQVRTHIKNMREIAKHKAAGVKRYGLE